MVMLLLVAILLGETKLDWSSKLFGFEAKVDYLGEKLALRWKPPNSTVPACSFDLPLFVYAV